MVAVVIPTTILLTLFASRMMGYTLNRVSLFALIFSIGILVDDAIVVIENIARHWAMRDGRAREQAAVEAVAEVGNPTIVATLTVVAALLPMLFVSGMMGPYMSPIPANASAAMLFSFFVAVMLTPWLMMKVAGRQRPAACPRGHARGGWLGRAYVAVARPILQSSARAWIFLLVVGAATLGSLALFYTQDVTVKLLPFDNKTDLQVVVDLPEGSSVEDTDRVLQVGRRPCSAMPEIVSFQTYAGTAAPFNFNGLVRHYYLRAHPNRATCRSTSCRRASATAPAMPLLSRCASARRPRHAGRDRLKVVEPPPGPPVLATLLAEIYGPDPETRRAVAAKVRETSRVPFIVDVDNSYGQPPERLRATIDQDNLEYYQVEQRDVYDTHRYALRRHDGRLFASRRRPPADPDPRGAAQARQRGRRAHAGHAGAGQRAAWRARRGRARRRRPRGARARLLPDLPPQRPRGRNGDGRARRRFRGADLRHARRADAIDKADWGSLRSRRSRCTASPTTNRKPTLLWDGEWEVTWVTFRDMGAAFMVAILGIYMLVVAQFGSFRLPLVILTPIPLTFIGIMLGHWLFGAPFSATSMIGFIALAGIIVRNSILLVDFIRHSRTPARRWSTCCSRPARSASSRSC